MWITDLDASVCIAASKINWNHDLCHGSSSDLIAVVATTSQRGHMKLCGSKLLPLLSTYLLQTRL